MKTNPVAVITGASAGIGRALAFEYAQRGFEVIGIARNEAKLEEVKTGIEAIGGHFQWEKCDIADSDAAKQLCQKISQNYPAIEVLILNAGISMRGKFEDCEVDVLKHVMDVNFWGSVYFAKGLIQQVVKAQGSIVGVSSVTGIKGLPGRTAYAASKFALNGFLESLRMEYDPRELHVMVSCPGWTSTDIRKRALNSKGEPQGESPRDENKMDRPEKVAKEIYFAMRRKRTMVVHSRVGKTIFWLNKFFPNYVESRIRKEMIREKKSPIHATNVNVSD
jgi:short-subunit dehydrogenase